MRYIFMIEVVSTNILFRLDSGIFNVNRINRSRYTR